MFRLLADQIESGNLAPAEVLATLGGGGPFRGGGGVAPAPASAALPELRGAAARAARYIDAHPGASGDEVAAAVNTSPENFRRAYCGKLRPRGYANRPGRGYHPPPRPTPAHPPA